MELLKELWFSVFFIILTIGFEIAGNFKNMECRDKYKTAVRLTCWFVSIVCFSKILFVLFKLWR